MPLYVAVTGCAGFIGRVVTRKLLDRGDLVYGIDSLTYAADPLAIEEFRGYSNFCFVGRDIRDPALCRLPDVDSVIHLAAETHVDNSLETPRDFYDVNVLGTLHLLELVRAKAQHGMPRFIHISTDEVYGPIKEGKATPDFPLKPSSPYSASKAAADLLVQAYGTSFAVPYTIIRPTNCYGPNQYVEKLIPKAVRSLMLGRPIPVHGDGQQTRSWLSVADCADAILFVLDNAEKLPSVVNVGGNREVSVADVVRGVTQEFGAPEAASFGFTRNGQDERYAVCDKPLRDAGWYPRGEFFRDLQHIVKADRGSFRF
jgi:dTDP-glucose 4,6-dehydratase